MMGSGAIFDVLKSDEVELFIYDLSYPDYFPRFIGTMKFLGVAEVLVPRFRRLIEWAHADLTFDVSGALYTHQAVGNPTSDLVLPEIGIVLLLAPFALFSIGTTFEPASEVNNAAT